MKPDRIELAEFIASQCGPLHKNATPDRLESIINDEIRFEELLTDLITLMHAADAADKDPDCKEAMDCLAGAMAFLLMCRFEEHSPWRKQ